MWRGGEGFGEPSPVEWGAAHAVATWEKSFPLPISDFLRSFDSTSTSFSKSFWGVGFIRGGDFQQIRHQTPDFKLHVATNRSENLNEFYQLYSALAGFNPADQPVFSSEQTSQVALREAFLATQLGNALGNKPAPYGMNGFGEQGSP